MDIYKKIRKIFDKNKVLMITDLEGSSSTLPQFFGERDGNLFLLLDKDSEIYQVLKKEGGAFFKIGTEGSDFFLEGRGKIEDLGNPKDNLPLSQVVSRKNPEVIPAIKGKRVSLIKIIPNRLSLSQTSHPDRLNEVQIDTYFNTFKSELRHKIPKSTIYLKSIRAFAFPATVVSVLIGTFLAPNFNLYLFLLVLLGILLAHAGVNVISDYVDFKKGYDEWDTMGSSGSRVLVDGLMSPHDHKRFGIILLLSATAIGLLLVYLKGMTVLWLALVGGALGIFYTVFIGLKYRALGDLAVFFAFGPLLALGAYFVQTSDLSARPFIIAIPAGFLVASILHANNFRDIRDDKAKGYKTIGALLGERFSPYYYLFLVVFAYILTLTFVGLRWISPWTLITFAILPVAIENIKISFRPGTFKFGMLDFLSSKHELYFGLLFVLGLILGKYA